MRRGTDRMVQSGQIVIQNIQGKTGWLLTKRKVMEDRNDINKILIW